MDYILYRSEFNSFFLLSVVYLNKREVTYFLIMDLEFRQRSLMVSSRPLGICSQRLRKDPLLYQLFNLLELAETQAEFLEENSRSYIEYIGRRKHPNYPSPMVYSTNRQATK